MPEPEVVNPHNFDVQEIIYNLNGFSVAWGRWEGSSYGLAMRWNGEDEDQGYPKTFGHPVWFILPRDLSFPILQVINEHNEKYRKPPQQAE